MSNKELLELAAKAAGIEAEYVEWTDVDNGPCAAFMVPNKGGWGKDVWNPLTNDGDRYRLARDLKLRIDFQDGRVFAGYEIAFSFTPGNPKEEAYAIVRTAAEIGRILK